MQAPKVSCDRVPNKPYSSPGGRLKKKPWSVLKISNAHATITGAVMYIILTSKLTLTRKGALIVTD